VVNSIAFIYKISGEFRMCTFSDHGLAKSITTQFRSYIKRKKLVTAVFQTVSGWLPATYYGAHWDTRHDV